MWTPFVKNLNSSHSFFRSTIVHIYVQRQEGYLH